jgi:hypothetical protein
MSSRSVPQRNRAQIRLEDGAEEAYDNYDDWSLPTGCHLRGPPHNVHHERSCSLNAGKHVFVEKPIALNRAQTAEMVGSPGGKSFFAARWTFTSQIYVIRQLLKARRSGESNPSTRNTGNLSRDHRI